MKVPGVDHVKPEKDLPFPIAEFQRRLARVRQEMVTRRLDLLVVSTPENIYYLSGYHTAGYYCSQCLLVPLHGQPIHITRGTEETNAKALSWIDQTASYMDHEKPIDLMAGTIVNAGYSDGVIGVEKISWFITIADFERLQQLLPRTKFNDGSMIVETARVIKSDREIDYIRSAAQIAGEGIAAGIAQIHAGAREDDIAAEMQRTVTSRGSEYPSLPVFVASGVRSSQAHATWAGRKLAAGDPVLLEISGCVHRYSAALMRSAVVGPVPHELERMGAASRKALETMLEAIRPGRPLGEVWQIWANVVTNSGYEGRFKRTGYSIGVNFPPDWGEGYLLSFKQGETRLLEPNMTFHIPSMIKVFGFADVGTSETVRVTETGCEILTHHERRLYIC
jgi:Xaa-Pro dipeptidase